MKLKKLIYILLILLIFPVTAPAEEYPYLPTFLKEEVISLFGINTAGKTMLYERVNIYDDFDTWMIGWFDNDTKIVTGITDTGDILYYSISNFNETLPQLSGEVISSIEGADIARDFLYKIMPRTAFKMVSSNAYEYNFSQTHNGIRIAGRDATVVVDKLSGNVVYYKGFGQTDSSYELMERLVSPEHAFDIFYENIGLELVYNTVYDHAARIKTMRPMYILNRSNFRAVDAQSGEIKNVLMHDYNYYYNDSFYDEKYYSDNNIFTEEKVFTADGTVSASGFTADSILKSPHLGLSLNNYSAVVTPGRLNFYSNPDGSENSLPAFKIDIVPLKNAVEVLKFSSLFDSNNIEELANIECDAPIVFARAFVHAQTGRLLDYETVKKSSYVSDLKPHFSQKSLDNFITSVAGDLPLRYYGALQLNQNEHKAVYAKYSGNVRVIGEGASIVYDSSIRAITDYTLVYSDKELLPEKFMLSKDQIKDTVRNELALELFYVDRDENKKHVVYDVSDKTIAFDPFTCAKLNRLVGENNRFIGVCTIGSDEYLLDGIPASAPKPIISSDKLCLPVSLIASSLGYELTDDSDSIYISNESNIIKLSKNKSDCTVNDKVLSLDLIPVNDSGNIYVSVQSLRTLFGMYIHWDIETNKIYFVK